MNLKGSLPILATLVIGIVLGWLVRGVSSIDKDTPESVETLRRSRQGADQSGGVREKSQKTRSLVHDIEPLEDSDQDESLLVNPGDVTRLIGSKVKLLIPKRNFLAIK